MPTKVKKKKTQTRTAQSASKTAGSMKKTVRKKSAKSKTNVKKAVTARRSSSSSLKKRARRKLEIVGFDALVPKLKRGLSGHQTGDLQGLSTIESADSESVAELLEEGNTFEAEAVAGVEAADLDEREVQSHEVLEDDVPDEYLHDE
jgi:hypothetical protein